MNSVFSLAQEHKETYLTRIFGFFLENNPSLADKLIRDVFHIRHLGNLRAVWVEYSERENRPDLILVGSRDASKIAIEIKIDAPIGHRQLARYRRFGKVVFIYNSISDTSQLSQSHAVLAWQDIYEYLARHNVPQYKYLEEFLRYLEERKMAVKKVTRKILKGTRQLMLMVKQIKHVLEAMKNNGALLFESSKSSFKYNYGYIGWKIKRRTILYLYLILDPLILIVGLNLKHVKAKVKARKKFAKIDDRYPQLGRWGDHWLLLQDYKFDDRYFGCSGQGQAKILRHTLSRAIGRIEEL